MAGLGVVRTVSLVALVLFAIQGCVLVPIISSFKDMGVTKEDRVRLLEKEVGDFNSAMAVGANTQLMNYIQDDFKPEFALQLRSKPKNEQLVDSKLSFVDFSDDGYHADVEVLVRFFRKETMLVKERTEVQRWYFSMNEGWKLGGRTIESEQDA